MTSTDWKMRGTEGTDKYQQIARNLHGRVGIRPLGDGRCRIRVVPTSFPAAKLLEKYFLRYRGWKQPGQDGEFRFSIVTSGDDGKQIVIGALAALKKVGDGALERNPAQQARQWRSLLDA